MNGLDRHLTRLRRLAEAERAANRVVFDGADYIRGEAHRLISAGSVSGRQHVPSAPGEPPNRDTGNLQAHLTTTNPKPLFAEVRSEAPYAAIQEFGGTIDHPGGTPYFLRNGKPVFVSNKGYGAYHHLPKTKPHTITLPSRPYMRPARDKMAPKIRKLFASEMRSLVRRSGR